MRQDCSLLIGQRHSSDQSAARHKCDALAVGREIGGVHARSVSDFGGLWTVEPPNVQSPHAISHADHRNALSVRRDRDSTLQARNGFDIWRISDIKVHHRARGSARASTMRVRPCRYDNRNCNYRPRQCAPLRIRRGRRRGFRRSIHRVIQREPRVANVAQTPFVILHQAALQQLADAPRQILRKHAPIWFGAHHGRHDVSCSFAHIHLTAREHFE